MFPGFLAALPGLASAAGGIFGLFKNKHNSEAPMNAANQFLNKIPGETQKYYKPYMDAGSNALDILRSQYGNLINNPGELYNKFSSGYTQSPGYKTRLNEALNAATNAQAAGGMAGSPQHQQIAAQKAVDLSGQDFENYLSHILGLYGGGIQGEQGLENQGYGANTDFANMLASIYGQQGKMAYEAENAKNTGRGQSLSNIFGGIGAGASGYNSYKNNQDVLRFLENVGGY